MRKFLSFLRYNNMFPIVLGIIFLGATTTFAAQNPDAIYGTHQQVVSIDNTYLVEKDLSEYTPRAVITGVHEDGENYYVDYDLYTIGLKNDVWQDVTKKEVMQVAKAKLTGYRDLGSYATFQLSQVIDRELTRLKTTQKYEKKQVSRKVVTTSHSGLIGTFVDATTEVVSPHQEKKSHLDSLMPDADVPSKDAGDKSVPENVLPENTAPQIVLLGSATVRVPVGGSYDDLGVRATDPEDGNLPTAVFVDGKEVSHVAIDTSSAHTFHIRYTAKDSNGLTASRIRTVVVYASEDISIGDSGTTTDMEDGAPGSETGATGSSTVATSTATSTSTDTSGEADQSGSDESGSGGSENASSSTATTTATTTATSTDASESATSAPDVVAPTITLNGENPVELAVGDAYTELGATATDDVGGDISEKIETSGRVDTTKAGDYTIHYTVSDDAGNVAFADRTIVVSKPDQPDQTDQVTESTTTSATTSATTTTEENTQSRH